MCIHLNERLSAAFSDKDEWLIQSCGGGEKKKKQKLFRNTELKKTKQNMTELLQQ